MEYKKHYSDEELDEVVSWFKAHLDELPNSIYIDKATYVKDLKHTVTLYFNIVAKLKDNPTYAAQIRHLFLMREAVQREWEKNNQ